VSAHLARHNVEALPAILAIDANVASDVHDRAIGNDQRSISHVAYTLGNSLWSGVDWLAKLDCKSAETVRSFDSHFPSIGRAPQP
jgi:hypothetical protein